MRTSSAILLSCWFAASFAQAQGFKFSNPPPGAAADAQAQAQREATIDAQLSTPCRDRIKNRKIMVLVGEQMNGYVMARQGGFTRHVEAINSRLRNLGLRAVYLRGNAAPPTPDEITAVLHHPDGLIWRTTPDSGVQGPDLTQELWRPFKSLLRRPAAPA